MRGISSPLFMILVLSLSATIVKSQNFDTFIPRGYELLDSKSGDLNQDGIMDYVIICKNPKEDEEEDAKRPLMILHGNPNGSLTLIERNDNIVLCFLCGGAWGDPYEGMTLKKTFFRSNIEAVAMTDGQGLSHLSIIPKTSRIISTKMEECCITHLTPISQQMSFTIKSYGVRCCSEIMWVSDEK